MDKYDVQAIINDLKEKTEMKAEQHDGCYELMRATIEAYARLADLSELDYKDLNLVYLTTIGTWSHGLDAKKNAVNESHLLSEDKEHLIMLWDETLEKAGNDEYSNKEASAKNGCSIGLFGTGFFSFKRGNSVPTPQQTQSFIRMLIDILPMTDDDKMFARAEEVLSLPLPGMQTAAASMILHCLKPYSFPVLNFNTGYHNIFEVIGVQLTRTSSLDTYIDNCRKIKAFRDQNFSIKNYRIFDVEAQKLDNYVIPDQGGKKVWLLTWNKDNWHWEGFADKCDATAAGETFVEDWTCSNTNPKIGDEIFLMKLGKQPRGIIGHGRVIRESYEKEHFDPAKAAAGKTSRHIDIEFDRLINYEKGRIVSQDELKEKCGAQHWSPQNSGIEIKPEVLPTVYALWNEVAGKQTVFNFADMVSFLSDYNGKHYVAPDKAGDQAEYMVELKRRGQEARQKFIAFSQKVASQIPGLEFVSCSNWMNQGQIVQKYLWIELKRSEWNDYPQSVSLSIEEHGDSYPGEGYYMSVRAGSHDNVSKTADNERQFRLLDCALLDGMTYRARYNDHAYYYHGRDTERIKALRDDGTVIKVEVIEAIENLTQKDIAGTVLEETVKAAKEIQTLYEYIMRQEDWWPNLSEYDPGLTAEQYHDLFLNESVVKRTWLQALYELYQMPDHLGTCKQLGDTYGYAPGHYISYLSTAAGNIMKATKCPILPREEENSRYWPVLFQGKRTTDKSQGSYCWKMREPVVAAMERLISEGQFEAKESKSMPHFDRNTILYGPPGTGKTYNSVIYAVAICDGKPVAEVKKEPYSNVLLRYNELRDAGRIAFTTFHQSYGYEEFIEGIKPRLGVESDTLGYTIEDGVFKSFCGRARAVKVHASTGAQMKAAPRIWGMILGGTGMTELKKQCFENDEIRLGWSQVDDADVDGDFVADGKVSWNAKHMVADFKNSMEIGDVVVIEKNNKSIDAIGVITGDYVYDETNGKYPRSRTVEWLVKDIDQDMKPYLPNGRKQLSRFSVFSFDYIGMDVISQILDDNLREPVVEVEQETKPYVFIIDEINRGNISKIFGELITLIEETKRAGASEAMEAVLPYSGEKFSVPQNVYILGTMNTADRSIAIMDTALRRRFEFIEMMPDSKVLSDIGADTLTVNGEILNIARMLDVINARIEFLYDREHTIGHAFFAKLAVSPSIETLAEIFEKNIIPLLQEYFYEDYEKIQLVLGDNGKEDEYKFILDLPIKVKDIFNGTPDVDMPEKKYVIQRSAFRKFESYKRIGRDL